MKNEWKRGLLMFIFLFPFNLYIFRLLYIAFESFPYSERGFYPIAEPFSLSTVGGFFWAGILALFFSSLFALALRGVEKQIVSNKNAVKWSFKFYGVIYLFFVLLSFVWMFWRFDFPIILIGIPTILVLFFSHLPVLVFIGIYNHIKIRRIIFWVAIILSLVLYEINIYLFSSCSGWRDSYCIANRAYLGQDELICRKGNSQKIIDTCIRSLKEIQEGAERKNSQNI